MTAKSPAGQCQLKEFESVHDSLVDIIGQLRDIDPSRLSFSPFLDLDTQISLAPISDSPESSLEELHSTENEEDKEGNVCSLVAVQVPELATVDHVGRFQNPVTQKNPGPPEAMDGSRNLVEDATLQDGVQTVAIRMPSETSFLDAVQPLSGSPQTPVAQQGQLEVLDSPDHHEHQPFLEVEATRHVSCHSLEDSAPRSCGGRGKCCRGCSSDHMKAVASAFVALLLAPWFLYGFYYFLPLQAPTCPELASRMAFALRCLLIAGIPILLGITLRASSALCLGSLGPLDTCSRTVLLHQMFVAASVDQFAIFCLNLVVTATFIPQEHLRLIPIFAGLFSVGRFSYWVTLHLCSAYRGFGFGLSFFPNLALMAYNLFCLYVGSSLVSPKQPCDCATEHLWTGIGRSRRNPGQDTLKSCHKLSRLMQVTFSFCVNPFSAI
ncbi:uncharacterized protein LOC125432365 isoform X2 [Sphaerodactylus townsendi]|uniref:uncharacterized protein LOC125432365 isoform X2 n=1 Tax=Sphaerodactylus townsendi TaxID=933632 RepID=UPI002027434F|nr:uncharacterized protein LOC125432365 isoform X2 [Sphaerodactylus townsendi]